MTSKVLPSLINISPWCGLVQPLVLGVHWTAVFFPADDRLWQTVDLALESSNTRLLSMYRLWLDMEVCHGCRGRKRGILGHNIKTQLQSNTPGCLQERPISVRYIYLQILFGFIKNYILHDQQHIYRPSKVWRILLTSLFCPLQCSHYVCKGKVK